MAELTFYTNPMSRGRIVRWMLEEVGAPYETELLDYASTLKGEAFRSINPMMKIPAIVHRGKAVTECAAICLYLADAFPEAGLAPATNDRADYYRWMLFAAGPVEQAVTMKALGVQPEAGRERMLGFGSYDLLVDVLDRELAGRDYLAGGRFSAADLYLGAQLGWGMQFGTLPKRESFEAYVGRLTDRPAYKRAVEIDDALMPQQPQAA